MIRPEANYGTHYGVERAYTACRKISKNWKKKVYVLKCDVRKFFDSIDHTILRELILKKVLCFDTMHLIDLLFQSFEKEGEKGLPLGNVTSQLFSNIYLNELDQFTKHVLKARYYFRYCDDFIIIHENREVLLDFTRQIKSFLEKRLLLQLHPNKVEIRPIGQGIDFLGYVMLSYMIVLRTRTKRRIMKKIKITQEKLKSNSISISRFQSILVSYRGILSHCRNKKLEYYIRRLISSNKAYLKTPYS